MKKVLLLAALSLALACAPAAAAERVRITYASRSISSILAFIAEDKGFFKEEDLEPQLILTRGTTAIAAAAAGDVEAIHIMGSAIRGIIQGLPLKVLAVNQKLPLFYLVARPELKSFADLKGKTMAVTTFGGTQQLAGYHMLRKGGIDPAKDITTILAGDVPAQLQAQVSGPVQITVLSPPTVFVARDKYKLNLLASVGDDYINFISGLIVSEKTLREKSGLIRRTVRALTKANRYFRANENGSADILVKYLGVSRPIAVETYRYGLPAYTVNGVPTAREIEEHLKADAEFLKLKEPVKSSAVFDFTLQREVNAELGVK
ncbi:MAG TPA: ABC transporter substrate-binding protein [Candidatus Binatia bacterium]|jgi:NitT/TauT family transport system substrate-binding protein|nr:ABC transporter substrate-binding protein [Candidatus Binatia bacterium]